ncbi:unnamed protein product [Zymoseptoria tritici ST99CH_1A5]|uniref:Uncharacterized protein n=1 Tax=Zymoseptoria tritici ST99CH_1A5 TaxID=1276529 RepID=A0A1Y6LQW6_ZYMTR|nr:unnamed protein product [Zymoseptoria tritici ST99CH_1A5]
MPSSNQSFPTTCLATIPVSASPIHALTYSSGAGQYLLTGSSDRLIRLYNPASRSTSAIQTYSAHGYPVLDLCVSEDNSRFASVGGDKTVFYWDVATAVTVRRFLGHSARVESCAFGGEGDGVLLTGGLDGTVKVWDLKGRDSRPVMTLSDAGDAVGCIAVRGGEVFVGSVDGRVRVYDLAAGEAVVDCVAPGVGVTSLSVMRGGEGYLAGTLGSELRLMDRRSGGLLQRFGGEGFVNRELRCRSCLAGGDGRVVSGSEDGSVWVWDVGSGEVVERVWHKEEGSAGGGGGGGKSASKDVVSVVAWNPVRRQWASAGGDGNVVVWGARE